MYVTAYNNVMIRLWKTKISSHFREMSPLWYLIRVLGHYFIIGLFRVVWQSELAHLHLCVAESTVRDASIPHSTDEGNNDT